ncbi:MAG: hypothetical protein ACOY0T_01215, partial [Myxococcota bacterium]
IRIGISIPIIAAITAQIILPAPFLGEPQIFRNGMQQIFRNHQWWRVQVVVARASRGAACKSWCRVQIVVARASRGGACKSWERVQVVVARASRGGACKSWWRVQVVAARASRGGACKIVVARASRGAACKSWRRVQVVAARLPISPGLRPSIPNFRGGLRRRVTK